MSTRATNAGTSDRSRLVNARVGWGKGPRNCILIPLSRGKFTLIDASDFSLVMSRKWHWRPSTNSIGNGYAVSREKDSQGIRKNIFLHRLLANATWGKDVDHINRDSLDNRRDNLRIATRSQNIANCTYPTRPNQAGFRGVCFRRDCNSYRAAICINYRQVRGPARKSAVEAAKDYDDLALTHFGEFATLNFPLGEAK